MRTFLANVEMRIYELLGIKIFRKLVFLLERVTHRGKGQNINYHLAYSTSFSMANFVKYLFYNGSIHVRNLLVLGLLMSVKWCLFNFSPWDLILILLWIKDLYCVMLQRYNYLRISGRMRLLSGKIANKNTRRMRNISQKASEIYSSEVERTADIAVVSRLLEAIESRNTCMLSENDAASLDRLCILLNKSSGVKISTSESEV